jgi:DNA-binding MarR family transcriptional regulator
MSSDRLNRYVPAAQLFAARLVLFQDAIARRLGLSATDLKCFRLVEMLGPMTAVDLASDTGLTAATLSGVVERLVAHHYLVREQDQADRRRWTLRAVPEASKAVYEAYEAHGERVESLLERYTAQELDIILQFLDEFSVALKASALDGPIA